MSKLPESSTSSQSAAFRTVLFNDRPEVELSLRNYQWQHRIVLIFTPSERSLAYQQQMEQWNVKGIRERDIKIVKVLGRESGQIDERRISRASVEQLRQQFKVAPEDFAIILVGKDGTEKQRSQTPVDPATIFQVIDAMPMRQQEMHDRQ